MANTLERILSQLEASDETVATKTAAEQAPEPSAEANMINTVRALTEKTAAPAPEASPAANLSKLAAEAQAVEEQILSQKAASLGAALADGFMARFAQYDTALSDVEVKTASNASNDDLVKQAYAAAKADLEKQAQAEYERGYQDQLVEIQKVAAEIHVAGQSSARNVVNSLSK